ncbi:hypothetical protein [Granulosicoccus antarcticus]|uniref:Uncharacterized protein n=1 Tax=Granulosicoccus antarcticus IMCC3135 TaxID=1192854 RepID=A0A2Z2NJG8_9GAMM|nr:hypothetical protein [Granulosicoccus antarcticus]ASJ70645.1 hypothetical protein IMCC3135_02660 [Granulosicoccus antarcticus IMCC3135]
MTQNDNADNRPRQVTQMNEEEVEGRLSAHRYILSHLLARLSTDPGEQKALLGWLNERASVNDGEEDPGAVIVQGYAEQQARADEFNIISEELRKLVELDSGR